VCIFRRLLAQYRSLVKHHGGGRLGGWVEENFVEGGTSFWQHFFSD